MNKQQQFELFDVFVKKQKEILSVKGDDYSGDDKLSNFKNAASTACITVEQGLVFMSAIKLNRLGQLFSGKTPKNESVEDSVLDLANYSFLLRCILSEESYTTS